MLCCIEEVMESAKTLHSNRFPSLLGKSSPWLLVLAGLFGLSSSLCPFGFAGDTVTEVSADQDSLAQIESSERLPEGESLPTELRSDLMLQGELRVKQAQAEKSQQRASGRWRRKSQCKAADCQGPNASFMASLSQSEQLKDKSMKDQIMDKKLADELRLKYLDVNRQYDIRKEHHLIGREEERNHQDQVHDFARHVVNELKNHHIREQSSKAAKAVDNSEVLSAAKVPVQVAAGAVAIYHGAPVNLKLSDETRVKLRTVVPDQRGDVELRTPVLSSSVNFNGKMRQDPYQLGVPVDPTRVEDRYRFSVGRGIPLLDLQSGLSYGMTSRLITGSVSKQLTDNLSCVVDKTKQLGPDQSSAYNGQESVKILYGMTF